MYRGAKIEVEYRAAVYNSVASCEQNHLQLNTVKVKKPVVDIGKTKGTCDFYVGTPMPSIDRVLAASTFWGN